MNLEEVIAESVSNAVQIALTESVQQITKLASEAARKTKYSLDDILTEEEVAEYLKIEKTTLQQWRYYKKFLPYHLLGTKTIRYKFSDVLEFATSNKVLVTKQ